MIRMTRDEVTHLSSSQQEEERSSVGLFLANDRRFFPSPSETNSLIAQQLSALSTQDREQVYYDVHGVTDDINETPEFIQESLKSLELALAGIQEKQSYEKALKIDEAYVHNTDFRLKFLRAERFDAKAAALRLVRFFEVKSDLFGDELLCKDLVQDDLDEATLRELYSGFAQIMPVRDRAGRAVCLMFPGQYSAPREPGIGLAKVRCLLISFIQTVGRMISFSFFILYVKLRKMFYTSLVLAEDLETQRKGIVSVVYAIGATPLMQQANLRNREHMAVSMPKVMMSIPVRVEAIHLCHSSLLWEPLFSIMKFSMSPFVRVRTRTHCGKLLLLKYYQGYLGRSIDFSQSFSFDAFCSCRLENGVYV